MSYGIKRGGVWIIDPMTDQPRRFDSEAQAHTWGKLSFPSRGIVKIQWEVIRHKGKFQ